MNRLTTYINLYSFVVILYAAWFNNKNSIFCPHSAFMYFVRFSE